MSSAVAIQNNRLRRGCFKNTLEFAAALNWFLDSNFDCLANISLEMLIPTQRAIEAGRRHLQVIMIMNDISYIHRVAHYSADFGTIINRNAVLPININPQYPTMRFPAVLHLYNLHAFSTNQRVREVPNLTCNLSGIVYGAQCALPVTFETSWSANKKKVGNVPTSLSRRDNF